MYCYRSLCLIFVFLGITTCTAKKKIVTTKGTVPYSYGFFCHHKLMQSPINIKTIGVKEGEHHLTFNYNNSDEHIHHAGRTIKVSYDQGGNVIFDTSIYTLKQFHFHTPSEHLIDTKKYPLEMHIVHTKKGNDSNFLVIAVLFEEKFENEVIKDLLQSVSDYDEDKILGVPIDITNLFFGKESFYHYRGSLTTPPYTEAVQWCVYKKIHEVSSQQIKVLKKIQGYNARHVQKKYKRTIDSN